MTLRLLTAALLLSLATPPTVLAQWWNPVARSRNAFEMPKPVEYTPQVREMAYIVLNEAIASRDWPKVDRMYDEFLAQDLRANDGIFMVEMVQRVFADRYGALEPAKATAEMAD